MAGAAHSACDTGRPNEFRHDASSSARLPGWHSRLCVRTHAQTERGSPKRDTARSPALPISRSPSGTKGGRGSPLPPVRRSGQGLLPYNAAGAECSRGKKRSPRPRMKIPRTGPKRHDTKNGNTERESRRKERAAVVKQGGPEAHVGYFLLLKNRRLRRQSPADTERSSSPVCRHRAITRD